VELGKAVSGVVGVLKDWRTSTKLLLLCGVFVGSIVLATYGLIKEKLIAIDFVQKELVGTDYLQALQGVYAIILATANDSPAQRSIDAALKSLAAVEVKTDGASHTSELSDSLAATVRALSSAATSNDKHALTVAALAKARDLASRIGDESKLTLDPDLDSYYVQDIVVKRVPDLFSELGELQSLISMSAIATDDAHVRALLLDGMIRSAVEEIERDAAAAVRGHPDDRLKQSLDSVIGSMRSAVNSYLRAASPVVNAQGQAVSLTESFTEAVQRIDNVATISREELQRLLNKRLNGLRGNLLGSLLLIGTVAGLSLIFAVMTYRQIVRPLGQLEALADKVGDTKDYRLRLDLNRGDEIGRLASAFNEMLEELSAAREREITDHARNVAMQAELARVSRLTTMGEMAASIAHEINQPLAGVVNNANAALRWLDRQPPNIEEAAAALRRIAKDGERGSGIIGSIRAMVKKGAQDKAHVEVNELIRDVIRLTEGQFQRHGVSLQSALADDLPRVLADRVQLQQVLLNLLMNAAEATLPVSDRQRLVSVRSGKHDGQAALIEVEDSGTGIGPEDQKQIFDAFFTTKAEGMGMGLSICRSIVESHGGRIAVVRGVSYGSVFQIILPGEEMRNGR
jgi:signal transduction histidine kinase